MCYDQLHYKLRKYGQLPDFTFSHPLIFKKMYVSQLKYYTNSISNTYTPIHIMLYKDDIYRGLLLQVNRLGNLKIIVLRNEFEWKYIF